MNQGALHITSVISENPVVMQRLTNGLHWEIAPEGTKTPLAYFTVTKTPGASKDFGGQYLVNIYVFDKTLTESAVTAEIIETEVKEDSNNNWRWVNTNSGYTSEEAKEAFIQITFNFKL